MEYIQSELLFELLYSLLLGIAVGALQSVMSFLSLMFNRKKRRNILKMPDFPDNIFNRQKAEALRKENIEKISTFSNICLFLSDILFFIVLGVALSIFYYYTSDGEVRVFAMVGVFVGFCLYRLILKKPIYTILLVLSDIIDYILNFALFVFCSPFALLYVLLRRIIFRIRGAIYEKISKVYHNKMIKMLEASSHNGFLKYKVKE